MGAEMVAPEWLHTQICAEQYGPWNADTAFAVRLQGVPLTNRPDVIVYRAEAIDLTPTRPEHVLLVIEVVSPGPETTDRIVKADQYAKAGTPSTGASNRPPPASRSSTPTFSTPPARLTGKVRPSPV